MNGAHIHLLLNHFPILGSLFALCLIFYGAVAKNNSIIKTALVTMVFSSLIGIPAFLSGEDAEHIVEPIMGVNKQAMEAHEDASEFAYYAMLMSGAIALGTLFASRTQKKIPALLVWINIVMISLVFSLMARTGLLGGEIRHSEINATQTLVPDDDHD
jgi:uncharacterized membrane protein